MIPPKPLSKPPERALVDLPPDTAIPRPQPGNRLSPMLLTEITAETVANPDVSRLMAYWQDSRGDAAIPSRTAIDPFALKWCLGHLMVVEALPDGDFVYRLYGSLIVQTAGFDMTGRKVSEFSSEAGRFFAETYRRCLDEGRPLYTQHQAIHANPIYRWERLLLPFATGDGTPNFVLVYNRALAFDEPVAKTR